MRVEGYQSNLRRGETLFSLRELTFNLLHSETNRFHGVLLQSQVESGINAIPVVPRIVLREFGFQLLFQKIDEVWSFGGIGFGMGNSFQWRRHGGRIVGITCIPVLVHQSEDKISPYARTLWIASGTVIARTLYQASQGRRFREREIRDFLAEKHPRCFTEAVNVKSSVLTEIDLIGIELEDFRLGKLSLKTNCHERFHRLAFPSLPPIKP